MIRKLNTQGKLTNFSSLNFIGGGSNQFVKQSRIIFDALSQAGLGDSKSLQRQYRVWKRMLEELYLAEEIIYRARYLASEAIKQFEIGDFKVAAYDFRRAALLVLNHYVE